MIDLDLWLVLVEEVLTEESAVAVASVRQSCRTVLVDGKRVDTTLPQHECNLYTHMQLTSDVTCVVIRRWKG